jgi:tubulin-specific chaperone D
MDKDFTVETVIPNLVERSTNSDLCVRHGAVVGLSEIVLALKDELPEELEGELSELVPKIEKLRLYRGRGGEIMRAAVCRYIECLSLAKVPLTVKQQVGMTYNVFWACYLFVFSH